MGGATAALATFAIFWPVAFPPGRHQEVCRNWLPTARGRLGDALRERRHGGHDNRRMRPLQWLCDKSLADVLDQSLLRRDVPIFPLEIVGRLAGPDIENLIDRFQKHLVTIGVEIAEQLRIRQEPARAYAENQTPI